VPVQVREISEKTDIRRFVDYQWAVYRGDPNWVPPLKSEMWGIVTGKDNPLFTCGPHSLFLAEDGGSVVGRVMAAIDSELNGQRGRGWGYFSLFESVNDGEVASLLLTTCEEWLRARGCRISRGPVSPDNGDDYRGLLIQGFDSPPVLMDSYNPPWYADLIESCGYKGDGDDRLAYLYDVSAATQDRTVATIEYAKSRWGFRVDRANLKDLENEFKSLKTVVDAAMPEWPDMVPPTMEELRLMAKKVMPVADADLIYIARSNRGEPIGFLIGLPDYNQVLRHTNGTLFPLGWLKFLWYRRKIKGARMFVLFVVPKWQKKAVSHAMFLEAFLACKRKGIEWVEGSTIVESNGPMNRDAVGAGGKLYKKFRAYEKPL
jgi:GNAT superfamily N-acetyltransferase